MRTKEQIYADINNLMGSYAILKESKSFKRLTQYEQDDVYFEYMRKVSTLYKELKENGHS